MNQTIHIYIHIMYNEKIKQQNKPTSTTPATTHTTTLTAAISRMMPIAGRGIFLMPGRRRWERSARRRRDILSDSFPPSSAGYEGIGSSGWDREEEEERPWAIFQALFCSLFLFEVNSSFFVDIIPSYLGVYLISSPSREERRDSR